MNESSQESNLKFAVCFMLNEENNIEISISDVKEMDNEDLERICLLLYSLNTGLLYPDILTQLSNEAINSPEAAESIVKLVSALNKMGKIKNSLPSVLPTQVFGRMNGA